MRRTLYMGTVRVVVAVLTAVLSSPALDAQSVNGARSIILGAVTDSGLRPISGVDVSIALIGMHALTDARGEFRMLSIPAGDHLLIGRHLGFRPLLANITVGAADTLRLALFLERDATVLALVVVNERTASPRLQDFEDRRKRGNGEFFDQRDIESRGVAAMADIIRESKNVRVTMAGGKLFAMSSRQWTSCAMQIYVDGIPLAGGTGSTPLDLNLLPSPQEIMAMEIYAGAASVPLWLPAGPQSGKRGCGAILLWTRDGSVEKPEL